MSLLTGLGTAAATLERVNVLLNGGRRPFKEGVDEHGQEGVGQLPYVGNTDSDTTRGLGKFIAQMNAEGFVRKNYFFVDILTPHSNTDLNRKVSLLCETATMPGYNVASSSQMFAGYQYEVPYGVSFSDVTMTFYVDGKADVKGFFDNWLLKIFPDGKKWDLNYANEYVSTVTIAQINNVRPSGTGHGDTQKTAYEVQLIDAFPKTVGELQYMQGSQGEIHTLTVTFTYKKWVRTVVGNKIGSGSSGGNTITDYNIGSPKTTS